MSGNGLLQVVESTDSSTVNVVDYTPPTLTHFTMASSGPTVGSAVPRDVVTLEFTASENITSTTCSFSRSELYAATRVGNLSWVCSHTVTEDDPLGILDVAIDAVDMAGNRLRQVTTTTDRTSVEVLDPCAGIDCGSHGACT